MSLPDHATADALLQGHHDGYRTYGRNYPPIYDEGSKTYVPRNIFVHPSTGQITEDRPMEEGSGSQNMDIREGCSLSLMDKMKCSTSAGVDQRLEDLTLPPIRSLPIWGIGNFHDDDKLMDNAGASTNRQTISPQQVLGGPFAELNPVCEQVQPKVQTPSRLSNPFFDNANHQWRGKEDTPALLEYMKERFNVQIHSKDSLIFIQGSDEGTYSDDSTNKSCIDPLSQSQFVQGSSPDVDFSPQLDGGSSHQSAAISEPQITSRKYQYDKKSFVTPSRHLRNRYLSPSPHMSTLRPGTQAFNNSQTAATPSDPDFLDTLFVYNEFGRKKGFICTYKCPRLGDVCGAILSGRDRRNLYRHAAIHAQVEEEIVSCGVIAMEDALVLTRLSKMVVKCKIEGCDFEKEVWRTDHVKERHEMKAHPEVYKQREEKKAKKDHD